MGTNTDRSRDRRHKTRATPTPPGRRGIETTNATHTAHVCTRRMRDDIQLEGILPPRIHNG
eukprot:1686897-Rhodomonas_salina.1